jgi:hypothetical protein
VPLVLEKPLQDRISIYYANGDLKFRAAFEKNLQFNLGMAVNAAITAEILNLWRWERRWRPAESVAKTIDMTKWPSLMQVNVKNESHGTLPIRTDGPALNALIVPSETTVTLGMEEGDLNVLWHYLIN